MADLVYLGFDLADKYRIPTLILSDGALGQMMESVEFPEYNVEEHLVDHSSWTTVGRKNGREQHYITSLHLLSEKMDRYELIKLERKWYRSSAKLNLMNPGEFGMIKFLNHRFIEFSLDMARVLDPMHIEVFHERKDLYYRNERGFVTSVDLRQFILNFPTIP